MTFADPKSNFIRRGAPGLASHSLPVRKSDSDRLRNLGGNLCILLCLEPVKHGEPVREEGGRGLELADLLGGTCILLLLLLLVLLLQATQRCLPPTTGLPSQAMSKSNRCDGLSMPTS